MQSAEHQPDKTPSDFRLLEVGVETASSHRGGLNQYFLQLVRSLGEIGVHVQAITMGREVGVAENEIVVPAFSSLARRLIAIRSVGRKEVAEADIVDAHFALTALPLVAGLLGNRPLVVHFQGPWADESATLGQAKVVCELKRAIERIVYHRASSIVVLSKSFRRLLIERYAVSPWNIEVIHPGVDTNLFRLGDRYIARSLLDIPVDAFAIVTVRRLVPRMGLDVMVEAWAEVLAAVGSNAYWLVVGDGPSKADLVERVAQSGIAANVRFLGSVAEDILVTCYQAADISIVPSLELEGFGLVTLESLACGTPVVATDVGGLREAVGPLSENLLVPAGDVATLAERIVEILRGTIDIPTLARCRAYAEQFSWTEVADRHRVLFRHVLEGHRPSEKGRFALKAGRKIRVVVIGHTASLSGGELAMVRMVGAILESRVHVILAEDGPLVPLLEQAGATVEVLPLHSRARELRRNRVTPGGVPITSVVTSALYAIRLANRIRRLDPDLVHTNTLKAAVYGGIAAKLARRPCLWQIHDRISRDYLPSPAVRIIGRLARSLPTAIVVNSNATLMALKDSISQTKGSEELPAVSVIPCPVLPNRYTRGKFEDGRPAHFIMVGRLAPWKGQDIFLRAFADAFAGGPERAILAGAPLFGEDAYHHHLVEITNSLGIDDQVEFRGFVHDVPQLLTEVDVLVHASVIPEPFGQVVVEGMAAGLAVVASDQGGPAEVVTNGVDGLLVRAGVVADLAETLRRLAENDELRSRLGRRARESAKKYQPELVAAEMLALYNCVAGGARATQPSHPNCEERK